MKLRFALAAGIGGLLLAGSASAQPTTAPAPTVPAPVVGSGPVVTTTGDVITTAPVRRGLFGRARTRGTVTGPVMTTTPLPPTVQPQVAPAPTTVPAPMPTTPRSTGPVSTGGYYDRNVVTVSGTTTAMPVVTAGGRTMMRGTVVTAGGPVVMSSTVMPASGMMVVTDGTPMTMYYMEPTTVRRGLFGRMRVR
jgi:hypothetical protein